MQDPIRESEKEACIKYITKKIQEMIKQLRSIAGLNTSWNEQRHTMDVLKKFLDYREDQAAGRISGTKLETMRAKIQI